MAKNRKHERTFLNQELERIDPLNTRWYQKKTLSEHLERYKLASKFINNKVVVDLGCGTGYGSFLLANAGAKKVYSIDIDSQSIKYALKNYKHKLITYLARDALNTRLKDKYADIVVSFEIIEHVKNYKQFVLEVARILKPNGLFIFSTPNEIMSLGNNPYHFKEFTILELKKVLTKDFFDIEFFGQRKVFNLISKFYKKFSLLLPNRYRFIFSFRPWENFQIHKIPSNIDASYLYLIVICKKKETLK